MTGNLDFVDLFFTNCSLGHIKVPRPSCDLPNDEETPRSYKGQRCRASTINVQPTNGGEYRHSMPIRCVADLTSHHDACSEQNCEGHVREIAQCAPPQSQQKRKICEI